jgi:hypothetical protein
MHKQIFHIKKRSRRYKSEDHHPSIINHKSSITSKQKLVAVHGVDEACPQSIDTTYPANPE